MRVPGKAARTYSREHEAGPRMFEKPYADYVRFQAPILVAVAVVVLLASACRSPAGIGGGRVKPRDSSRRRSLNRSHVATVGRVPGTARPNLTPPPRKALHIITNWFEELRAKAPVKKQKLAGRLEAMRTPRKGLDRPHRLECEPKVQGSG
jgi:hypothetical protein